VDSLTGSLLEKGFKVMPYHAGLTQEQRRATQDAFAAEECDLIVATVAFGMGIDRSNIRFVLHSAMPKSLEHYQQETGRAGRDGLQAECVLLYSAADTLSWKAIQEKSVEKAKEEKPDVEIDPEFLQGALQHVEDMDRYARGAVCRHKALVGYFGQGFASDNCEACDICLEETESIPDGTLVAQKIISCVARMKGRFGIGHLISVLRGEDNEKVRKFRHDQLSTHGILREQSKADLRDWALQLIGQGALAQELFTLADGHQVPLVVLNPASWEVMRGQRSVRLVRIARKEKKTKTAALAASWEGVDAGLFEVLRGCAARLPSENGNRPTRSSMTRRSSSSRRSGRPRRSECGWFRASANRS
jgi:ATP-dependent DNA helicase RecQ